MKIDTIKVEKTVEVEEKAVTLSEQEAMDIGSMLSAATADLGSTRVLRRCPDAYGTLYDMIEFNGELDS